MITEEQSHNQTWEATVNRVEHAARTVVVTILAVSGERKVRVPKSIDMGTTDDPKIRPGDTLLVRRDQYRKYVALQHIPKI